MRHQASTSRGRSQHLRREVFWFTVVGALAFVVDNGGYTVLVFGLPGGDGGPLFGQPIWASVLATSLATVFAWIANRTLTYAHAPRGRISHELGLFVGVNIVAIVITAGCVAGARAIGFESALSDNLARILGFAISTVFRFISYRKVVFVS